MLDTTICKTWPFAIRREDKNEMELVKMVEEIEEKRVLINHPGTGVHRSTRKHQSNFLIELLNEPCFFHPNESSSSL